MFLLVAAALLLGFVANVAAGSISGQAPLSDVAEAILLLCASIAFVSGVLRLETREGKRKDDHGNE